MVGVRMVKPPALKLPPDRYLILAASLTIYEAGLGRYGYVSRVSYLVKGREDVVCELNFRNRSMSHESEPNTKACNALLC